jgi:hypothetical protein
VVSIPTLWLPILVSAIIVFLASWILHMFLPYHRSDFQKVPSEDEVQGALRKFNIAPGDYMIPCGGGPDAMKSPEFKERFEKGPVVLMTVFRPGSMSMGPYLVQWFVYCIVVSVFAAYITGRSQSPGSPTMSIVRFAGCTAFIAYSIALWQDSIWYKRKWSTTIKNTFDGLVYGLLTACVFGWLWPR